MAGVYAVLGGIAALSGAVFGGGAAQDRGGIAGAFALAPRIEAAKTQVASFESVSPEHPVRREFSRLHGISMGVNLAILAAGVVLVLGHETFRR